jgi:thiaminase/transcriptional activator TenA
VWDAIYAHPFLKEVEDGTLPDDRLLYYFVQNVHYIRAAVQFSAMCYAKARNDAGRAQTGRMFEFGRGEVARQVEYVEKLADGKPVDWTFAPTSRAYTRHLLTLAAYGGVTDLLVGMLPCEWTYAEFSDRLYPIVEHPVHKEWLASFVGDEHKELSYHFHELLDELLANASDEEMEAAKDVFHTSSRYEWMFWEMAYTKEQWPI